MDNYERMSEIGSGSFGKIYKVLRKTDNKVLARKEIQYSRMNEKERLQLVSEVNILRELSHPNIVKYYERIVDREEGIIFIVMEYCNGGDLASFIKKHRLEKTYIDEKVVWKLFAQITLGLHACHNFKHGVILHRDLKPENVFLDSEMNAKIGDFGLSRVLEKKVDFAKTFVGTPYYMSPEQVCENIYDIKSDIWSLGCILYEICALCPPFDASNQEQLTRKIVQGSYYRIPSVYSENLTKLVKIMLQTDPSKRPTTADLLSCPPIRSVVVDNQRELEFLKKEEELSKKSKMIALKERNLTLRENQLLLKEKELAEREEKLSSLQKQLNLRKETMTPISTKSRSFLEGIENVENQSSPLDRLSERMAKHMSLLSAKKTNFSIAKSK